jgi:hypothetical protein
VQRRYLDGGEWCRLQLLSGSALAVLALVEARHFRGRDKTGLACIAGLDTPDGPLGMSVFVRRRQITLPQLVDVLHAAGVRVTTEQAEDQFREDGTLVLADDGLDAWLQRPRVHYADMRHCYTVLTAHGEDEQTLPEPQLAGWIALQWGLMARPCVQ